MLVSRHVVVFFCFFFSSELDFMVFFVPTTKVVQLLFSPRSFPDKR